MKKKYLKYIISAVFFVFFVTGIVNASIGNIETEKTISFINNDNLMIEYSRKYVTSDKKEILIYEDEENNEYFYKKGNLVAYVRNETLVDDSVESVVHNSYNAMEISNVPEENIEYFENIANDYLNTLITKKSRSSSSNYELIDATYLDATKEYSYIYSKKIGNYIVNDGILISVDKNGDLVSYSGAQQGLYDNYYNITIDEQDVSDFIEESMIENNITNYEINTQFINFVDNKLVLQTGITIINDNNILSSMFIYYEL